MDIFPNSTDNALEFELEDLEAALELVDQDLGSFGVYDLKEFDNYKEKALKQMEFSDSKMKKMKEILKDYRFVNELDVDDIGRYVRWINIKGGPEANLTNGGIIVDLEMLDGGLYALCKNKRNMMFRINIAGSLLFQKMNDSELLIKSLYDYSCSNEPS